MNAPSKQKLFQDPPNGDAWDRATQEHNWLAWKLQPKDRKKPAKVPVDKYGSYADVKVAATLTLDEAIERAEQLNARHGYSYGELNGYGVGYLAREGSELITVDLDNVIDPDTGALSQTGQDVINNMPTYYEQSVSGKGLRAILQRGDFGGVFAGDTKMGDGSALGIYCTDARFAAISGNCYNGIREPAAEGVQYVFQRIIAVRGKALTDAAKAHSAEVDRWWVGHWLNKLPPERQRDAVTTMLDALPASFVENYDEWLVISIALHDLEERLGGLPWVKRLWDTWSMQGSKYDQDENDYKWESFEGDPPLGPASIFKLLYHAKEAGFDIKPWMEEAEMARMADWPEEDDLEVIEEDEDEGEAIDLTRPPGLLGDMITAAEVTSGRETRFYGLAGSLVALAAASGHKWMLKSKKYRTPLNLQVILAAPTGGGKEEARKVVTKTYQVLPDKTFSIGREPASDAALHQMFTKRPSQVIMIDEFGQYLQAMEKKSHDFKMLQAAMTIFTSADSFLAARSYANAKDDKPEVHFPFLNALHTTTPGTLFSGLEKSSAESGFLGRYMMLVLGDDAPLRDADDGDAEKLWQSISERLRKIADFEVMADEDLGIHDPHMLFETNRDFRLILCDDAAMAYLKRVRDAFEARRVEAPDVLKGLWSRGFEMVCKICGIVALGCAEDLQHPVADETAARYAAALVEYTIRSVATDVVENAADGEFDGIRKSILRAVIKHADKDGWAKKRNVLQATKGGTRRSKEVSAEFMALADPDELGLLRLKTQEVDGVIAPVKPYQVRLTKAGQEVLSGGSVQKRGVEILDVCQYRPLPDIR